MNQRRFPRPWTVEDVGGYFVVKVSNDRPLLFVYYGEDFGYCGRRSLARLLTRDAARRSRQALPGCLTYFGSHDPNRSLEFGSADE